MSTITLTLTVTSVTLAAGRAALTASVTNNATVPDRIVLGAFGPADGGGGPSAAPWTTVDRPSRDIAAGATEQFTVTVAPPTAPTAGSYPVRFIAYSADQAPEEHADQAKQVDVVVPAPAPPAPPPKKPWWPWAVAAALVVIVGGVAAWVLIGPGRGPQATPSPSSSSASPLVSPTTASPANPCQTPYVPRLTRPSDLTCVTGASAAEVVFDNNPAVQAQRRAGGGAYGPDTCKQGWVWRDAYPGDHVCVTGATRDRTAAENTPKYTMRQLPASMYPTLFLPISTP